MKSAINRIEPGLRQTTSFDVTVVVCSYSPDIRKLLNTIASILMQENVIFQIVIADDGSPTNHFESIEHYLLRNGFHDYVLLGSDCNRGTVINILEALEVAGGNFIKVISPGDYLYSPNSLFEMIQVMSEGDIGCCFGRAVYYSDVGAFKVINRRNPVVIKPYLTNSERIDAGLAAKLQVQYQDFVLGAAMAFRRDVLYDCLWKIAHRVKYCEDYSMQLYLLQGGHVRFVDCFVVWYEVGTGLSTSINSAYKTWLRSDAQAFYETANEIFPGNPNLAALKDYKSLSGKPMLYKAAYTLFYHPQRLVFNVTRQAARRLFRCRGYDKRLYDDIVKNGSLRFELSK